METITIIIIGVVFGLLISYGKLNKYNTIAGLSVLKDFTVAKTIMLVLGVGGTVLMFEMMGGGAVFHVKPFNLIGIVLFSSTVVPTTTLSAPRGHLSR